MEQFPAQVLFFEKCWAEECPLKKKNTRSFIMGEGDEGGNLLEGFKLVTTPNSLKVV